MSVSQKRPKKIEFQFFTLVQNHENQKSTKSWFLTSESSQTSALEVSQGIFASSTISALAIVAQHALSLLHVSQTQTRPADLELNGRMELAQFAVREERQQISTDAYF